MVEVYMTEKRGALSKFMGMFSQGSGMLQAGVKGKEAWGSLMGGGGAGGGGGGAGIGAGAGAYSLGVGNVAPVTEGMSPTLGGGAAASGGSSAMQYAGPAAALGTAAVGEYQYQKGVREGTTESQGAGRYAIGQGNQKTPWRDKVASGFSDPAGATKTNLKNIGLGLTGETDRMDAIGRRMNNYQTASRDIDEAQKALKIAGLPPDERRSIAQKLEKARQKIGAKKYG